MIVSLTSTATAKIVAVNSAQVLYISQNTEDSCRIYFSEDFWIAVEGTVESVRQTLNAKG